MRSRTSHSLVSFTLGVFLATFSLSNHPAISASSGPDDMEVVDVPSSIVVDAGVTEPVLPTADELTAWARGQWVDLFVFGDVDAQRWAAEQIVLHDTNDWPEDYRGVFLHRLAPGALVTAHRHQIPPSVTIAQAVLESGWGRSSLAHTYNNLFGVKALRGHPAITLNSAEVRDGVRIPMRLSFAVFDSWDHAIEQHGELLAQDRYARARRHWTDWSTFIEMIAPIYASDPRYATRISTLIRNYGLDRWDELVVTAVDMAATRPDHQIPSEAPVFLADDTPEDMNDSGLTY